MMARWRKGLVILAVCLAAETAAAADYKTAPPEDELEARAREYVVRRRIVALLLVGGTLAGGLIGMVSRRRARADAARHLRGDDGGTPG